MKIRNKEIFKDAGGSKWRIDYAVGCGEMSYWDRFGVLYYPPGRYPGQDLVRRMEGGGWCVVHITYDHDTPMNDPYPSGLEVIAGPFPSRRIATAAWKLITS